MAWPSPYLQATHSCRTNTHFSLHCHSIPQRAFGNLSWIRNGRHSSRVRVSHWGLKIPGTLLAKVAERVKRTPCSRNTARERGKEEDSLALCSALFPMISSWLESETLLCETLPTDSDGHKPFSAACSPSFCWRERQSGRAPMGRIPFRSNSMSGISNWTPETSLTTR